MDYLKKIDWNVLNNYINDGLITKNKHPEYDIWVLNYSPKTQAKGLWDLYTLSCRGLIIDIDGNILARPFQKFKNIEEHDESEFDLTQDFDIFEKLDGSLIILFYYKSQMKWIVASRGSFISEQSIEAKKILYKDLNLFKKLNKKCTYLFEIIYKKNRIVVDYGDMYDLILLSRIETNTNFELFYDDLVDKYSKIFTIVNKINIKINNIYELKQLNEKNKEGFVVRFFNGFRVKIKFEEYVRLHGILTNVSNIIIWEHLKNNYDFNKIFDKIPDEFYNWIVKTKKEIISEYNEIERNALKEFIKIFHINNIKERKSFALESLKTNYSSILFKLYDKKEYNYIIWDMIKPKYSKPFNNNDNINDLNLL